MQMKYKVLIQNVAKEDFRIAKSFYKNTLVKTLDKKFAKEIKFTIANKIAIYPTVFAIRYKNVRIAYTYKFPYAVHFFIEELNKTIFIIAIIHTKRLIKKID